MNIWDKQGWAAVTMRGVCAQAGLVDRYFYESFADRDELLAAIWDQVRDETIHLLLAAFADQFDQPPLTQLRIAISAFVGHLVEHPDRAQIFFGDHAGSAILEQRRRETVQTFTDLLASLARPYLKPGADENALRMSVLMGIGGFNELITAWHAGIVKADAAQIIEQAAQVGADLGAQYLPEDPTRSPPPWPAHAHNRP